MTFHWPYVLFALPLVLAALLGLFALSQRARVKLLTQFAAARLLATLLTSYSPGLRRTKQVLLVLGLLLVVFALSRPQWGYDWQEQKARGVDVVFALDTSKSMLAEDIAPNRLERAKLAIIDLVEKMPGNRVGLVAFAGQAFLQCPLTLDYDAFRQSLEAVDTRVIERGGTNIAAGLAEAETALENSGNHKIVVLVTDGEDLAAEGVESAREAREQNVIIYTVGVGTPDGEIIPVRDARGKVDFLRDDNGQIVKTKLDAKTLASIAETTGGFYVPMGATGEGLTQVYEAGIKTIPAQEISSQMQRQTIERFQWPLAAGLLLLTVEAIVGTRRPAWRRRALAAKLAAAPNLAVPPVLSALGVGLIFFCCSTPLGAAPAEPVAAPAPGAQTTPPPLESNSPAAESRPPAAVVEAPPPVVKYTPGAAEKLFAQGDYKAAAEAYGQAAEAAPQDPRFRYNQGTSLYRGGDYDGAAQVFQQALNANDLSLQQRAYYNLANSLYRVGQAEMPKDPKKTVSTWEQADKNYQNALDLNTGDNDARYNRELLKKQMEELKKKIEAQEKQQQQNQQNQDQNNPDQQNQQNQQQNQSQNSQGGNPNQPNQSNPQNQSNPDKNQSHNGQDKSQQSPDPQKNDQNSPSQQQNQQNQSDQGQDQSQKPADQPKNQSGSSGQDQPNQDKSQNPSGRGQDQAQNQQNQRGDRGQNQPQNQNRSGQQSGRQNQPNGPRGDRGQPGSRGNDRGPQPQPQGANPGQDQNQGPRQGQNQAQPNQPNGQSGDRGSGTKPGEKPATEPAGGKPGQEQAGAQGQAGAAGDKKGEEGGDGAVVIPGVMTREEARQMLNSLRVIERKLPASRYDEQKQGGSPNSPQQIKDW